ncbi:MAG TPA: DMT family transporter [Candidatus Acidoferrales bacterium]|nr:DMT family transporter [Candidatus Acidoferrales bacterium]
MTAAARSSIFHPLAILPAAIWGGTWIALKISHMGGTEFAFARSFFGGVALFGVAALLGRRIAIPGRLVPTMILMSLTFGAFFGLAFTGAERLPAALGSLLGNIAPISTLVLAALFLRERPTLKQIAGIALAFAGVCVIAFPKLGHVADLVAIGLMLAGAFMQSVNTICMKRAILQDQIVVNAFQCTFGGLAILAYLFATGSFRPIEPTAPVIGSIVYVALLATALANLLWSRALTLFTASTASLIIFMAPVFGHVWSWLILHEPVDPFEVAGAAMVIAGMAVSVPRPDKEP